MSRLYLVTGAAGHLGNTVIRQLCEAGQAVRALVLPGDKAADELPPQVQVFRGDVRSKPSMELFFNIGNQEATVIHCAGIVSIASGFQQAVYDVNVTGTKNIVALCEARNVKKLVYVSSVHALPVLPQGEMMREVTEFDPKNVTGAYAKTKAEATAAVLKAAGHSLNISVVHPSGICGPFDYGSSHTTQLVLDGCTGKLAAGVKSGFDFVDVRDVAAGIISCCQEGRAGECYILSNRYVSVSEIFSILHKVTGTKEIKAMLPMWFAKLTAPAAEFYYKLRKQLPLYTPYSLLTLSGNSLFSSEKAAKELGYKARPFIETIADTASWLVSQKRLSLPKLKLATLKV